MIRARLSALAALTAFAAPAAAQTPLSGVTVAQAAPELPKVVTTFPEAGKSVAPGALILKVTFDQRMSPTAWDYAKGAEHYPSCLDRPRLLADEKTFVLLCTAGPNTKFQVAFNGSPTGGFVNLAGQRATPSTVDFSTDDSKSLQTIADAMKAAGLKADEGPVMDVKAAAVTTTAGRATP